MSVSSTDNQIIYTGTGSTGPFDFDFRIYASSDLVVELFTIATEVSVELEETTDYTVTIDGDGTGHIDTVESVASTHKLIITRRLPLTQEINYVENDKFPAATHEEGLDRSRMIDQQLQEQIDRCVKVPAGSTLDVDSLVTSVTEAAGAAETAQVLAEAAQAAAEDAQAAAEAAQAAAESAEGTATTEAGLATTAKTAAETARDAAQNYAAALKGTSSSSVAIGTGAKTFTTQTGKQFAAGMFVLVVDQANSANWIFGQVTSYSSTTLVIDSQVIGGSGTIAAWNIYVAGIRGAQGSTGAAGADGKTWYSGSGAPSDASGVDGDFYLNTTTYDVFKKAAGTWGTAVMNIKGATGATGATGAAGDGKFNTATTTVKTDNYTVQASDFGNVLVMNNASAKAFTLPNINTASVIILKNIGAGLCTITPDASDTCDVASLAQNESVTLVADTTNNVWRNVAKVGASASATELSFTSASLSAGVLTVTHNKALAAGYTAIVAIIDNTGNIVIPDAVNTFATNSFKVDLTSYGTISGTWYCLYITK